MRKQNVSGGRRGNCTLLNWTLLQTKRCASNPTVLLQYQTFEVLRVDMTSCGPFWRASFCKVNLHKTADIQCNCEGNICNVVVITVPTDGLAPLGARASAGLAMKKFGPLIYTGTTVERDTWMHPIWYVHIIVLLCFGLHIVSMA